MFLPDRYIKGTCPNVRDAGPVRRQLRELRRHLCADRPDQPVLGDVRRHAGAARLRALLLRAGQVRTAAARLVRRQVHRRQAGGQQRRGGQAARMAGRRPEGLGHLARCALLRLSHPRRAGQVLLRVAGRAGRLPGQLQGAVRPARLDLEVRRLPRRRQQRPSCTTSSARTSSISTACSGRRCCTARTSARRPRCTSTAT